MGGIRKDIVKICKICKRPFHPNKYHLNQEVCSRPACQAQRQILNQRAWRKKNRFYFAYKRRDTIWQESRAVYLQKWREEHRGYFKAYRLRKKRSKTKVS